MNEKELQKLLEKMCLEVANTPDRFTISLYTIKAITKAEACAEEIIVEDFALNSEECPDAKELIIRRLFRLIIDVN